ncbi:glycosyltransferase [Denitrificimonas caeni]|uniref:glycosyltransferase n=1 Tax=Denitrificimonas caeni TaxID=521720 RepID=UPI001966C13A|nr:glycosyltransferase [Denitrificimonas caeni]
MEKIAIVSRSFWPENPAIGEALLLLSESLGKDAQPIVITQVAKGFPEKLQMAKRGQGVKFSTLPSLTNSSSHMLLRIVELLTFTVFVFFSLCWHRPSKVYVATNPPIFTPLAVRLYCGLFGKKFVYHLQDIHPEATQVVTGKTNWVERLLRKIDVKTTRKAATVITLTEQMKSYITQRTGQELPIVLLENPSVQGAVQETNVVIERKQGFVYCGNAGRLQRIPLLLAAIERYLNEGGQLPFVFAGGGVYRGAIEKLASQFEQVSYLGVLPADQAAAVLRGYSFGLMPIDDEVTNYAFPSKSSSYVFSGCHVIAICGGNTSVTKWVLDNGLGFVAEPDMDAVVSLFHKLEREAIPALNVDAELFEKLTPQAHAASLEQILNL